ncbi:E motif [Dillenia turbinata]|uniref:E motif n=1 Tax=Dillenia turbinata TaxID=194707 RepID=A0AAN8V3L6_9MAGN
MHPLLLEPNAHTPAPPFPPPLDLNSDILYKKKNSKLCFRKLVPAHQTHLSFLNGPVNSANYASILDTCRNPNLGKQVHAHTIKSGFCGHEFIETKLLQMYGKCGCFEDATILFDRMLIRNLHSWIAILNVYVENEFFEEACLLFSELQSECISLDFFVFPIVLKICSGLGEIELGKQVHGMVIKNEVFLNIYVVNAVIDMYGKCGCLDDAKKVLATMPRKDRVSWNSIVTACANNGMVYEALEILEGMSLSADSMPNLISWSAVISGFSQNGYNEEVIELLSRMQIAGFEPNAQTLASVLPACARLERLSLGKEIHGYIIRHGFISNRFVVNGLVDVYRRCGDMESAFWVFSKFSVRNEVSCNTMIVGYCENGHVSKAKELFEEMEQAGIKRSSISWNSMISGYVENCLFDEAIRMLRKLLKEEVIEVDSYSLGSALAACAGMPSLGTGKEIHSQAIVRGLQSNPFVGGALVEMYCKCLDLEAAQTAFNEVTERETATWNALISGYARCNQFEDTRALLQQMKEDGFEPNAYTWNGIIAGSVENGNYESSLQLFSEMQTSNLRPDKYTMGIILNSCSKLVSVERGKQVHAHTVRCGYESHVHIGAALVDMYAKCGSIKHALQAFNRISNPNLVCHNAMLTAYAMHGFGRWSDLARIRQTVKERGMLKSPGCSWIEDKNEVHLFLASDKSHKKSEEIYATLDQLAVHMKIEYAMACMNQICT